MVALSDLDEMKRLARRCAPGLRAFDMRPAGLLTPAGLYGGADRALCHGAATAQSWETSVLYRMFCHPSDPANASS